jgi:hypothetical protein
MTLSLLLLSVATVVPLWAWPIPGEARPHVRTTDEMARQIVRAGAIRSLTVARLLDDLDRANLVVYVSTSIDLHPRGSLYFLARPARTTYLVIRVRAQQTEPDRIAALAHELHHALEVAGAPFVVATPGDFLRLYQSIGFECGQARFETRGARLTEAVVRRELESRR